MNEDYSNEDVVIPEQEAIAVYLNNNCDIVIRQINANGDDDSIVLVKYPNIPQFVAAISRVSNESREVRDA